MTFSRGTCYALGWTEQHPGRVRSISIGDYPAREIPISPDIHPTFSLGRWRGTPVADRIALGYQLAPWRDAFTPVLVRRIGELLQDSFDDLLGPAPGGGYRKRFIDRFNLRVAEYGEFGWYGVSSTKRPVAPSEP